MVAHDDTILPTVLLLLLGTWLLWGASGYLIEGKPLPKGTKLVLPGPYSHRATAIINAVGGLSLLWWGVIRVGPPELSTLCVIINVGIIGFRVHGAIVRTKRNDGFERQKKKP